jgi:nicotinamide riboside kinase
LIKIAFCGAQDTGKTTLAKELSSKFKARGFITDYVDECARTYIAKWSEPISNIADQLFILDKQIEREQCVSPKCDFMFTDSALFLSYIYTLLNSKPSTIKDYDILLHIYSKVLLQGKYDIIIYLTPFREPVYDGIRTKQLISLNSQIDSMIRSFLDLHCLKYITVSSPTLFDRIEQTDKEISKLIPNKEVK